MIDETQPDAWEEWLKKTSHSFPYPPTPEIAGAVARRIAGKPARRARYTPALRLAFGLAVLLILALLAVPSVRAQVLDFIQVGIIRIFVSPPTETPLPVTATPATRPTPFTSQTAPKDPTLLTSLTDMGGETTLEEAKAQVDFTVLVPTYPENVGLPDRVFLQDLGGDVLVLVWMKAGQPDQVDFSLHQFGPGTLAAEKWFPEKIEYTLVNGQNAVWTSGSYLLLLSNGDLDLRRLVQGHVLVWSAGEMTYRLETNQTMLEAVKMAESLQLASP